MDNFLTFNRMQIFKTIYKLSAKYFTFKNYYTIQAMNRALKLQIEQTTALRASREATARLVLLDSHLFPDLLYFSLNSNYPHQHQACWVLEWVYDEQPNWFEPHIPEFFSALDQISHPGALRSISRISMLLIENKKLNSVDLSIQTRTTETMVKWFIEDEIKVATKVYAMKTLFYLSKNNPWIIEILEVHIQKDFYNQSAGYKSAAKKVLHYLRK